MDQIRFSQKVRDYVQWRFVELGEKDPSYFAEIASKHEEAFGDKPQKETAASTDERTGFWLHWCGEWRVEKLRQQAAEEQRKRKQGR